MVRVTRRALVTNQWAQWKQKLTLTFHFADEETQAQREVVTAPVISPGAQTPTVGSARPPSPGFGVGVPCKVLASLSFELTCFALLRYEFSKCFANVCSAFTSLCKVFLEMESHMQKGRQRIDRLCLDQWSGGTAFLTPKWDLSAEKGYCMLSYNFDKCCNKNTEITSKLYLFHWLDLIKRKLRLWEHLGHLVTSMGGTWGCTCWNLGFCFSSPCPGTGP